MVQSIRFRPPVKNGANAKSQNGKSDGPTSAITPLISVQAGYHYTDVNSDAVLREYSRNRVFAGVNLTF